MPSLKNQLYIGFLTLMLALGLLACDASGPAAADNSTRQKIAAENALSVSEAYAQKRSDVQVSGAGVVVKLLKDDNKGARHQKFLVKVNPRQTLLFAHNIDLAPRVPVQPGDEIGFSGEYVYNPKGGIVHWTHDDPQQRHIPGWIMLKGTKYQ